MKPFPLIVAIQHLCCNDSFNKPYIAISPQTGNMFATRPKTHFDITR